VLCWGDATRCDSSHVQPMYSHCAHGRFTTWASMAGTWGSEIRDETCLSYQYLEGFGELCLCLLLVLHRVNIGAANGNSYLGMVLSGGEAQADQGHSSAARA